MEAEENIYQQCVCHNLGEENQGQRNQHWVTEYTHQYAGSCVAFLTVQGDDEWW